jgi:hypothetical protein
MSAAGNASRRLERLRNPQFFRLDGAKAAHPELVLASSLKGDGIQDLRTEIARLLAS